MWILGLGGCQQTQRTFDAGSDASLSDAEIDGGAADALSSDAGTADAGEEPACEGNQVERESLVATSIEELRSYFGAESGFEGGELFFQEAISRDEGFECTNDLSAISYIVALPEELRPNAIYDRVAIVWGLNGDYWVALLLEDASPGALVEGRLPTAAVIELNEDTPEESADALVALVQERFALAMIFRLSPTDFQLDFPARGTQRVEPATSQQALSALRFLNEHELVFAVGMVRFGFSRSVDAEFTEPRPVSDAQIELDCLRRTFGAEPRYTQTSLPEPFGTGRTYECEVCPIEGICGPE